MLNENGHPSFRDSLVLILDDLEKGQESLNQLTPGAGDALYLPGIAQVLAKIEQVDRYVTTPVDSTARLYRVVDTRTGKTLAEGCSPSSMDRRRDELRGYYLVECPECDCEVRIGEEFDRDELTRENKMCYRCTQRVGLTKERCHFCENAILADELIEFDVSESAGDALAAIGVKAWAHRMCLQQAIDKLPENEPPRM
jgi:hypothetical protein